MHDVSWWLFIVASIVLIVTPGQDMILVMSRSIAQGSAAGVATAAGVSVGLVGHTLLATLGLGAILRTSSGCLCCSNWWARPTWSTWACNCCARARTSLPARPAHRVR
jgi:hypothetical protein